MKKQLTTILAFLFSIILMNQAGNTYYAPANSSGAFCAIERTDIDPANPSHSIPKEAGMSHAGMYRIDSIVRDGIVSRAFPGCRVLVLKDGKTIYDKCFGNYTYEAVQKVKPNTMYDLASLSKTTGTLLAIMKLYDSGKLKLTDKASKYLSFLSGTNKKDITITELLFHESGFPASLPFYRLATEKNNTPSFMASSKTSTNIVRMGGYKSANAVLKYKEDWVSKVPSEEFPSQVSDSFYLTIRFHKAAMQLIANAHLNSKAYCYSDLNFILLKEIVETITGSTLDVYLDKEFFEPMELDNLAYLPLRTHKIEEIAPTEKIDFLRNGVIQGYVQDPDAAFFGGISGNAGLFGSALDVAKVYQMVLNQGEIDGQRYLSKETCSVFTTTTSASGRRGLGYDKPNPANPKHSPCCISAPKSVYGHTGYTGTCCWVDPVNNLIYVFLSNRTYPNEGGNKLAKMGIRTKIQEVIYQSIK